MRLALYKENFADTQTTQPRRRVRIMAGLIGIGIILSAGASWWGAMALPINSLR